MPSPTEAIAGLAAPYALVLARATGLAWTAPGLSTPALGARSRLILAATLTALLGPMIAGEIAAPSGLAPLAGACLVELVIGSALGWAGSLVIAGARQAGEVVGAQSGLSPAALFDPEAGDGGLTPMGHLYGLVALGVFLALDGPTELVRALAESFRVVPAGGPAASILTPEWAFGQVGRSLGLAVRASAPVALALTLAGLALGLLGRAAPSLQLVSLSLPARTLLGLTLAALGLVALVATLGAAWTGAFPWALTG